MQLIPAAQRERGTLDPRAKSIAALLRDVRRSMNQEENIAGSSHRDGDKSEDGNDNDGNERDGKDRNHTDKDGGYGDGNERNRKNARHGASGNIRDDEDENRNGGSSTGDRPFKNVPRSKLPLLSRTSVQKRRRQRYREFERFLHGSQQKVCLKAV